MLSAAVALSLAVASVAGTAGLVKADTATSTASGEGMIDMKAVGSLTIVMKYEGKAIANASVRVYKVADIITTDTGYAYRTRNGFGDTVIDETSLYSADLASKLYELGKTNKVGYKARTSGTDGMIKVDSLGVGLYLVGQETAANGYEKMKPFLVTIPYSGSGSTDRYNVVITSKMQLTPKETEPPKENVPPGPLPNTGQLWWPVSVLGFAGVILVIIGIARRRRSS